MQYRRPAPSILFTAIAATIVLLPWALDGVPGDGSDNRPPSADDTALTHQPLTGLSAEETVQEVSQTTPFSMVALTATDLTGTTAKVRAKRDDGSWGPWYAVEPLDMEGPDDGPDNAQAPQGTEPVFVGQTTSVQIAITRPGPNDAPPPSTAPTKPRPSLGYVPATVEQPFSQNVNAVLISPPQAPIDALPLPTAAAPPGQPPHIIGRAQWGADESMRCGSPQYISGVRAGVVHHTAGSNDYTSQDSAAIIRAIYAYHTRTLGWCDIGYNALVDKYGQVFEGRAGGITQPVAGSHTGGFNAHTWGVAMLGDFEVVPPTQVQLRAIARLLGWRLAMDGVYPKGTVELTSAGGGSTRFGAGTTLTLPTIFTHRDVGITECPGDAAYALMDRLRQMAARFNDPLEPEDLAASLQGGAIYARWDSMGRMNSVLGAPQSPEGTGAGATRYVRFEHGAIYWSPETGPNPIGGSIYDSWASLGYERGVLGLPTSSEIPEAQWIVQNFQHGTLNFDREDGSVTRVVDGNALKLPPLPQDGPPVQLERFTPIGD